MRRNPVLVKSIAGVSAAAISVALPFAVTSPSLASSKASSSDLCSTAAVSPSDGVTATTHTVSVGGVNKNVCELTFKTVVSGGISTTTTSTWTVPTSVSKVDYVVVAGGGGGGAGYQDNDAGGGGGGGGGEASTGTDLPVSGTITVVVGAGGQGGQVDEGDGDDGIASSFSSVTARPGKAGLGYDSLADGGASGSGKTGGSYADNPSFEQLGGGGGGQVAQGQDATDTAGGNGGAGLTAQLDGLFGSEAANYSGGGGGGVGGAQSAGIATQGGGAGAVGTNAGENAVADSGGGGGGGAGTSSSWSKGGNGAGGIIRVRFLLPDSAASTSQLVPITPGSNPNIPANGVPLGGSVFLVNGQLASVSVKPDAKKDPTALEVFGDGFTMKLAGRTANDKPLGLTPDGALILEQDRTAFTEGTGFKPNSDVELYLFSEPRALGTLKTDASGNFSGTVPLPLDIPAGRHTLQSNGFAPSGDVRSLSLGVLLNAEGQNEQRLPVGVGLPSKSKLQSSLAKTGSYVVLKKKAITNAGQRVRVAVNCPAVKTLNPSGDVRACWLKRTKAGKVTLYVRDIGRVQVTLRMFAPATDSFTRLNVSKRYSLRLR